MAKVKLKTTENEHSVGAFLEAVPDERKRRDCEAIADLIGGVMKEKPRMWGTGIVGFGRYHYQYESGHEGDAPVVAFSPRKQNIVIYLAAGFATREALLETLGKHKTGKGCLYIQRLEDVSIPVLKNLIKDSAAYVREKYG